MIRCGLTLLALALIVPRSELSAQSLTGRVLEEGRNTPVADVLVSLIDKDGKRLVTVTSDSLGRFHLTPPSGGEYHIDAVRVGYATLHSPLLALSDTGVASVDLVVRPRPLGLKGLEVSVESEAEALLRGFGVTPRQMGRRWIPRRSIEDMPQTVGPIDIIRWRGVPGVWVREPLPTEIPGLCVMFQRSRSSSGSDRCAIILLNGSIVSPVEAVRIGGDEIESMAVLTPVEATTIYGTQGGAGAVLIWTRSGRSR